MLCYKNGSVNFQHSSYDSCCPELRWIGLFSSDVDGACNTKTGIHISEEFYQAFTLHDESMLCSLTRRCCVHDNSYIYDEVKLMASNRFKMEIDALHSLGVDYVSEMLYWKILSWSQDQRPILNHDSSPAGLSKQRYFDY